MARVSAALLWRVGVISGWRGSRLAVSGGQGYCSCVASWLGLRALLRGCALCAQRSVLDDQCLRGRGGCTIQAGLSVALCVRAPRGRVAVSVFAGRTGKGTLFVHSWWTLGGGRPVDGFWPATSDPNCVLSLCSSMALTSPAETDKPPPFAF